MLSYTLMAGGAYFTVDMHIRVSYSIFVRGEN